MPNYNIDDLGAIGSLSDSDLIEVLSSGVNYKGTVAQFKTALGASIIDWDMSTDTLPTGYKNGQRFYGTGVTSLTTGTGGVIPTEVLFTQIVNTPTDSSGFAFQYVI